MLVVILNEMWYANTKTLELLDRETKGIKTHEIQTTLKQEIAPF